MRLSRWVIITTYTVFAYISGFIPVQIDKAFLLRNIASDASVQGSATGYMIPSQVQEVEVGIEKADIAIQTEHDRGQEWGTAKQVGEHTWTMKIGEDTKNGTASEILTALNAYRQRHGKGTLSGDDKLAAFAQSRAAFFALQGDLDSHAGFSDFVNNQDGFQKLGFMSLGENSSFGYTLEAVHLIEWIYAGDKPHDDNQLNNNWTHVGIGVSGSATNLIFAANPI